MIEVFFNWLFGCPHKRTTWPRKRKDGNRVVCIECGAEFGYDWNRMATVGTRRRQPVNQQAIRPVIEMDGIQREIEELKRIAGLK